MFTVKIDYDDAPAKVTAYPNRDAAFAAFHTDNECVKDAFDVTVSTNDVRPETDKVDLAVEWVFWDDSSAIVTIFAARPMGSAMTGI